MNAAAMLEGLFLSLVLFLASGAVFPLLRRLHGEGTVTVGAAGPEGTLYALSFAGAAVLIFPLRRELLAVVRNDLALWLLPALALASTLWSSDPSTSLRSSMFLCGAMLVGAYFGLRFDAAGQLRVLTFLLGTTLVLSVALALTFPDIGIEVGLHNGAWHGLYSHKNAFGRVMVLTLAVAVLHGAADPGARAYTLAIAIGAGILIVLSQSRTSMVAGLVVMAFVGFRPLWRRVRVRGWMIAALLVAIVGGLTFLAWSQRASMLHPDPGGETLSGRTQLWSVSLLKIAERPLLGFGYMAFWNGRAGEYVDIWRIIRWAAPNAHNGFLDVALDLGLVGAALFGLVCVRTCSRTLSLQRKPELPLADQMWPSTFVVFVMIAYLTEGMLLQNNAFWMLFTAVSVLCSRLDVRKRGPRPSRSRVNADA